MYIYICNVRATWIQFILMTSQWVNNYTLTSGIKDIKLDYFPFADDIIGLNIEDLEIGHCRGADHNAIYG